MFKYNKKEEISRGKAKTLYKTDDPDYLIMEFRDDTSAWDGVKKEKLVDKGMVNNMINSYLMEELARDNIPTHFVELLSDTESLVLNLRMLPVECIVRNYTAGGICRRLGVEKGTRLHNPIFEFCLKNDELHDPQINEDHIQAFKWANRYEIDEMKRLSHKVNWVLQQIFQSAGLILVDFKLEFGWFEELTLGDEFTPDGCRLWDAETFEVYDKDRFRHDMGDVMYYYKEVAQRLGIHI